jgi:hypothetical protein
MEEEQGTRSFCKLNRVSSQFFELKIIILKNS